MFQQRVIYSVGNWHAEAFKEFEEEEMSMPIRVYYKMSVVGIDRIDLKSVHSLMQPLVIAPVVNVSSLWDVCMATYARPNWSGFMQSVCMGEHESAS